MKRCPAIDGPLTQRRLKKLLDYNPDTGTFRWKKSRGGNKSGSIAGCKDHYGYIQICVDSKLYISSRLAYLWMKGYFPEHQVDHEDRVRDNNKWENLRHITHQCNAKNRSINKNNKSGITGVRWYKLSGKWISKITVNGKGKHLGYFKSLKDAAQARWEAEVEYGFPNCNSTSSAYQFLLECN
jgi:hypothetical protein